MNYAFKTQSTEVEDGSMGKHSYIASGPARTDSLQLGRYDGPLVTKVVWNELDRPNQQALVQMKDSVSINKVKTDQGRLQYQSLASTHTYACAHTCKQAYMCAYHTHIHVCALKRKKNPKCKY